MITPADPREPRFLVGVLLTCMCGLMLQIMETRVLSVMAYYHLAFFSIGIAMLGMTAGALAVFYKFDAAYEPARLFEIMSQVMSMFAWTVLAGLILLLSLALSASFEPTMRFVAVWLVVILILLPPYVLLGIAVSLALTRGPYRIGLVYGVDLVGASVGCLATLILLTLTNTYTAILLVGALGAMAGISFRAAASANRAGERTGQVTLSHFLSAPSLAFGVLVLIAATNELLGSEGLRPIVLKTRESHSRPIEEHWNSFSQITMYPGPPTAFLWSASPVAPQIELDQRVLLIDGFAGTPMYRYGGDPRELEFLRYDMTSLAYTIRHQGRAAVIGIGGGRDLMTASIFGFKDITGVEYNPIVKRLFMHDYREFNGAGTVPGLRIFTDDARSWFARSDEQFDLIQMSLIDTFAATAVGAFTLSENGLYTVNGWKRFISRLTPTGVFTVSRWYSPDHLDETGRVLSLAMASLIELGHANPSDHIYLAANGRLSTLIVGRFPLTPSDLDTLDETVRALQFKTLAAPHRTAADPVFDRILHAKTTSELVRIGQAHEINISPTWDTNPFFFNQLRLSDPASIMRASQGVVIRGNLEASLALLVLILLSTIVVVVVVLLPARRAAQFGNAQVSLWSSMYFLGIGVAFMFVEIGLIQRMSLFLGHPIYGLAIVLFGIILATGIGSLVSDRATPMTARAVAGWPLALVVYLATLPLWLGNVLDATETGSLVERCLICLATMAPAGVLMGFMFPLGMRLCSRIHSRSTPWLWAINGAAGVLASGAAVLVSIETSLNVTLYVGAIAYALVSTAGLQLLRLGNRADADSAAQASLGSETVTYAQTSR